MTQDRDPESTQAAAKLYRLAQAAALQRRFHTAEGRSPTTAQELAEWHTRHPELHGVPPAPPDYAEVERDHPDLVALARRSDPHLSGEN